MPFYIMSVSLRGVTFLTRGRVFFWDLLLSRCGHDSRALIFSRPLGYRLTVFSFAVMGVTLSIWIPGELQGYTPWKSQVGIFTVAEARVAFRPMFPARKAYSFLTLIP